MASNPAANDGAMRTPAIARRLAAPDMAHAARLHRTAFDAALPALGGRHTPAEDLSYWSETLLSGGAIWGVDQDGELAAVMALRDGIVEQLHVAPPAQGTGLGSLLLDVAKATHAALSLWTFQRNAAARRFYERRGFRVAERTDGARNEERDPDMRYIWTRADDGLVAARFGDTPALAEELLALVLERRKTATCWAARDGDNGAAAGVRWVALDGSGRPRALLETVELTHRHFDAVDAAFARDEGEDDRTLASWRLAHERYFTRNGGFTPDMPLWCERFRLAAVLPC